MLKYFFVIPFFFLGCSAPRDSGSSVNQKRYPLSGKVISADRVAKKARIEHSAIAGFMPAMTMDFAVPSDLVWDDLVAGADIRAELVADPTRKEPYWLEKMSIVSAPENVQPSPAINENFAQVGRETPDFALINQDGKRITLKDYRGKTLALTFIYSECPLADYCIKMSTGFSDLANRLSGDAERRDAIRLLTVSFDPKRDTPEKLRAYGLGYLGKNAKPDFTVWQLAVGSENEVRRMADFFGLHYEVDPSDNAQFNHSLRTVVIGRDGKVIKIFPRNEWTPDELLAELDAAAAAH